MTRCLRRCTACGLVMKLTNYESQLEMDVHTADHSATYPGCFSFWAIEDDYMRIHCSICNHQIDTSESDWLEQRMEHQKSHLDDIFFTRLVWLDSQRNEVLI